MLGRNRTMFSVKDAARELGISVSLMYGLIQARKIRHERHGLGRGVIRIPADALQEYRRSCTSESAGGDAAAATSLKFKTLSL